AEHGAHGEVEGFVGAVPGIARGGRGLGRQRSKRREHEREHSPAALHRSSQLYSRSPSLVPSFSRRRSPIVPAAGFSSSPPTVLTLFVFLRGSGEAGFSTPMFFMVRKSRRSMVSSE